MSDQGSKGVLGAEIFVGPEGRDIDEADLEFEDATAEDPVVEDDEEVAVGFPAEEELDCGSAGGSAGGGGAVAAVAAAAAVCCCTAAAAA